MKLRTLLTVAALGLVASPLAAAPVVVPAFGAPKPAKKPAKKKGEAKEEKSQPGVLKTKIAIAPRGLKWGLANEAIAKIYDKVFDDEFVPLYKKAQPGAQMEALDTELEQKKQVLRRSRIEFGPLPTGFDNTELKGEYSYRNNESLSKLVLRSGTTRHFFFFADRLWKVYDEHKLRKGGTLGETYEEALQILTKRFGVAPIVLDADFAAGRPFQEALWHDGVTYVRAINREHVKLIAIAYVDKGVQDSLATYRKAKVEDPTAIDRDVERVTRKPDAPPDAPAGGAPPKKKKKGGN
jgi:hypothetical protein